MKTIDIEAHWLGDTLDRALRAQPDGSRDESLTLNERGDLPQRLADLGEDRIAAMDRAGIDVQIVSVAPPGVNGLPAAEAIAFSREMNDRAADAARRHPQRLRVMTALPMADPAAAVRELERSEGLFGHVGLMAYGRDGEVALDDPRFDEVLGTAARLGRPVCIHPQIPPPAVRAATYGGLDPLLGLSLATFGWGWHAEAGVAALRLIVSGALDRHPDLQLVLGHWGELLLFALDRIDSLSNVASHLQRRVAEYFTTNVHITTSGMLAPRLLRSALEYTDPGRILLSTDYPFHTPDADALTTFLAGLPEEDDRERVAHGNAEALFGLAD